MLHGRDDRDDRDDGAAERETRLRVAAESAPEDASLAGFPFAVETLGLRTAELADGKLARWVLDLALEPGEEAVEYRMPSRT